MRSIGFPELAIFVMMFTVVFLLPALYFRYRKQLLVHQERMAALEKGAELPAFATEAAPWTPRIYLLRGMIWLFSGLGLAVFLFGLATTTAEPVSLSQKLWEAERLRRAGATEDQVKQMLSTTEMRQHVPVGSGFIGLVPVGVGLAY